MKNTDACDERFLTEKEKRLMTVLFAREITEQDIWLFTQGLDVDTASSDYMLMLSFVGFSNQWKWFPKEMLPRLQGLYRYYQVRNAMGIKGLLDWIDLLDKAKIPVMLIKGMAMRYHYAAGVPRIMSDMDLLVPEDKFDTAVKLLCACGGTEGGISAYSMHINNGVASVDLHRWLFKHHGEKEEDIWGRAVPIDFYGRKVYVPEAEDMFAHQLDTRARAIFVFEAETRRMRWLYDCKRICMKEAFDMEKVMQRIKQFHIDNTAYYMLKAFADCFPEVLSDSFLEEKVTPTEDYEKWLKKGMNYRNFMRTYSKILDGKSLFKHVLYWPIMKYYDYQQKRFEAKHTDGSRLTVLQYLKKNYNQDSVFGIIAVLLHNAKIRADFYRRGD